MAQDKVARAPEAAEGTEEWKAFLVEQRGIDYVPEGDRRIPPLDLLWMWGGTTANVLVFVYGSLLIAIGLSFAQAVVVILIASFGGYMLLGVASQIGPNAGTSSLASARAPFGINFNRFNAFSNWALVVCYEVADLAVIVLAFVALAGKAGIPDNTVTKVVVILVAVAIQLPMPLFGHATIIKMMRVLVGLLLAFAVIMAILLAGKMHPSALHQHGSVGEITVAVALTLSGGGLGWVAYAADYSRYLPKTASKKANFWYTTVGAFVPQAFFMILGAAVTTTVPSASNAVAGVSKALPGGFVVPYLILAIISLYTVNTVDLYSSGLNLQATGIKIRRWQAVCLDLTIATILLFFVVFSSRFNTILSDFLLFGLVWISPFVGIYLTDWALRGGYYDPVSLLRPRGGLYWHGNGIRWPAAVAQVLGMVASFMWLSAYPVWQGPLTNATGGSDWDILFGGGVAAVIYLVFAGRRVREEGRQTRAEHDGLEQQAATAVSRVTTQ
jgi:nucleobase:cation symporter-1, NCS1 family